MGNWRAPESDVFGEGLSKVIKLEAGPADLHECRRLHSPSTSSLTPELKGFIDRVVVPILVQSYVDRLRNEKSIAEANEKAASCEPMPSAPQAEATR